MSDRPRRVFGKTYIFCKPAFDAFKRDGPFAPPYYDYEELEGKYKGQDVFIIAPGSSLNDIDPSLFDNKLTIAANSAGFWMDAKYWCFCEGAYATWIGSRTAKGLFSEDHDEKLKSQTFLTSARAARLLRLHEMPIRKLFITRHEETRTVKRGIKMPAITMLNAIASAWWFGCKRAIIFGMDLSKHEGPYVKGVPYTRKGAKNGYVRQKDVLNKLDLPGLEIHNVNPHSNDMGLKFKPMEKHVGLEALKKSQDMEEVLS